jgi:hypothetical protein
MTARPARQGAAAATEAATGEEQALNKRRDNHWDNKDTI